MNAKPTIKDRILNFIKLYQLQAGYPPTLQEISEAVGKGKSTVHYHIEAMVDVGQIERRGHSARAIRVL